MSPTITNILRKQWLYFPVYLQCMTAQGLHYSVKQWNVQHGSTVHTQSTGRLFWLTWWLLEVGATSKLISFLNIFTYKLHSLVPVKFWLNSSCTYYSIRAVTKENTAADGIGRHFHSYSFYYFDHKGLKEKSQMRWHTVLHSLNH